MNLTTVHSLWLAPLCLMLGGLLAWVLYRPGGRDPFSSRLAMGLAAVRALVVALIAFFLLEPMVRTWVREVRKPIVVIAHDGSASVGLAGDTSVLRSLLAPGLHDLERTLSERYQVRTFTYGQDVREGLDTAQADALTDLGQLFREVYDRFNGPDLGAVIITGDGIANRGRDPRLEADRLGVPVHVVALGDTTIYPDLLLRDVEHNRISYLGNEFPLRVRVEARKLQRTRTRIIVSEQGVQVAAREITIPDGQSVQEVPFSIKAGRPGLQRYTVRVEPVPGELSELNNTMDLYIDVLDDRQNIVLLADGPHPDLGALERALRGSENYEVKLVLAADAPSTLVGVDLLVMHGSPTDRHDLIPLLKQAGDRHVPVLFVLSASTRYDVFNAQGAGLRFTGQRGSVTDALAVGNKQFNRFTLDGAQLQAIERFPPLQVPFGRIDVIRGAHTVLFQRIGSVRTEDPLITVQEHGDRRMATILGEGLWRWRLADMRQNGSHAHFDGFIQKLVQFLALKQDRSRFRVEHAPGYEENEMVTLRAEVYNAALELTNDSEVRIILTDENDREYDYVFSPSGQAYRLDAGRLPAGRYRWKATTTLDGGAKTVEGEFLVHALVAERFNTVADHTLLADLAARSGGSMETPKTMGRLADTIGADERLTARSYGQDRFSDLVSLRWPFFLLLALLTLEWVVRRRAGAY